MIHTKIFKSTDSNILEDEIFDFVTRNEIEKNDFMDIKYSTVCVPGNVKSEIYYTAMVIYSRLSRYERALINKWS